MKVLLVVCLAFAGVSCEAEADPYTLAQVAAGIPATKALLSGQSRIITYPNGVQQAIIPGYAAHVASPVYRTIASPVYSALAGHHFIGKREAEAEAEPWTIGQVAAGIPQSRAAAQGRLGLTSFPYTSYSGLRVAGAPVVHTAVPAVASYAAAYPAYSTYGYPHYIGKREAEAEAEPWTIGQVAAGIPQAKAIAEGRAHLSGFTHTSYSGLRVAGAPVYHAAPVVSSYAAYPSSVYGYGYGLPYYG